jgi:hypothetical protein
MIIDPPPLQVFHELGREFSRPPGAAGEGGDRLPNGEIQSFDKGGVDQSAQPGQKVAYGKKFALLAP